MEKRIFKLEGFTMIELAVVAIIIAVLAGFAVPQYRKAMEHSKMGEAYQILGAMRDSLVRYYNQYAAYPATYSDIVITDFYVQGWDGSTLEDDGWINVATARFRYKYAAGASPKRVTAMRKAKDEPGADNPHDYPQYRIQLILETGAYEFPDGKP